MLRVSLLLCTVLLATVLSELASATKDTCAAQDGTCIAPDPAQPEHPSHEVGQAFDWRAYCSREANFYLTEEGQRVLEIEGNRFWVEGGSEVIWEGIKPLQNATSQGRRCRVFDVGGYNGEFTAQVERRYGCETWIFEPLPEYVQALKARFADKPHVHVVPYGLSHEDGQVTVYRKGDASTSAVSMAMVGEHSLEALNNHTVEVRTLKTAMQEAGVEELDLLAVNCEGCEYEVLHRALHEDLLSRRLKQVLVQFHLAEITHVLERCGLRFLLSMTHDNDFNFIFSWELWTKRD